MTFGDSILEFFDELTPPVNLPAEVDILWPYGQPEVKKLMDLFYRKYMGDEEERIFLIGINPGRFGAGITGLCFTDPPRLAEDCGISHRLKGGRELSADFVYRMIEAWGGVSSFYSKFYLTALSPVGFVKDGKNFNYYDMKGLPEKLDHWMAEAMKKQLESGANRRIAFSMGQGTNYKQLQSFNDRHGFFDKVEPLPHPRWVMQYRRKRLDEFIGTYVDALKRSLNQT